MGKNQRRRVFVDPKVQGALVRRFLLHWLVFVVSAFVLLFVWQVLVSGDPLNGFSQAMADVAVRNLPVFVALVVLLPVFVSDTVKLTNRFAGPVIRLRNSLSDVAAGEAFEPIVIRRDDFWHDLIDKYNVAAEHLQPVSHQTEAAKTETEPVGAL